jgi:electron transfer flavoprotein alpha subunit
MIQAQSAGRMLATVLDSAGQFARPIEIAANDTLVATIRAGVGEALTPDANRAGVVENIEIKKCPESVVQRRHLPADPRTADIRHLQRLVAGGRGLGGRAGFDRLRQVAHKLDAGIAATRAAVDAGWIEYERQVGQTGKTVKPDLYLACGISGASHHLEGISDSRHIISINSDPSAPIHQKAHLALVGDLYEVLDQLERRLNS